MTDPLVIDGSHGEGGGQILRTALGLAALSGRPVHVEKIRAGRTNPGLAAQHVTSIRAAAALCGALVEGDALGSVRLDFTPRHPVRAGHYAFDVAAAREGGSAGSATLVLQTVLLPLALADGESRVTVDGGTHMAWSPSFDYLQTVWLPAMAPLGIRAALAMERSGWFPVGQGRIRADIAGRAGPSAACDLASRGELLDVSGRAIAANLPSHIPQRIADRCSALLAGLRCPVSIEPLRLRAACAGAGLFLTARYETLCCGFSALGARGKPSETVAEEAAASLLDHRRSGAALDEHLGDQILVPLAMAAAPSRYTVERISRHLETNAWVLETFGAARIDLVRHADGTGSVSVLPSGVAGAP